jgi:tetratricopeptide (TPR) repeat protein
LLSYYEHTRQEGRAEPVARRLLELAPNHVETLEKLAFLRLQKKDYPEYLGLLQRALRQNPLDRALRAKVGVAHMNNARPLAEKGDLDGARPHYEAALALGQPEDRCSILCRWAAAEFKGQDNARGEELLAQAAACAPGPLVVSFIMLSEAARLKLPAPLKKRFDKEFNAGIAGPPTAAEAAAIAAWCASLNAGDGYHGLKTHTRKIIAYADRARRLTFTEPQLVTLCEALLHLGSVRATRAFIELGQRRFPANPRFPWLLARTYFDDEEPTNTPPWRVQHLLEHAEHLARALPQDEYTRALLGDIQRRLRMLQALSPFPLGGLGGLGGMGGMFGSPFDLFEDEDDDFDEEFGWEDEEPDPRNRWRY